MIHRLSTSLLVFCALLTHAQFKEDFRDGDLHRDPTWIGDTADFIVVNSALRSNSQNDSSGFSVLCPFRGEWEEWESEVRLDLRTSSRNYVILSLLTDSLATLLGNGLHVKVGGTRDGIRIEQIHDKGSAVLLDGPEGITERAHLILRLRKVGQRLFGQWRRIDDKRWSDLGDTRFVTDTVVGLRWTVKQSTPSFHFRHYLHRLYLGPIRPDLRPPHLLTRPTRQGDSILLIFDEPIYLTSTSRVEVEGIAVAPVIAPECALRFEVPSLPTGRLQLRLAGITDTAYNATDTLLYIDHIRIAETSPGSLRFNEILYDPPDGVPEFVELGNTTDGYLRLDSIRIRRISPEGQSEAVGIPDGTVIGPHQLAVLCSRTDELCSHYNCGTALRVQIALPSLLNKGATLILDHGRIRLDSVRYSDAMHHPLNRECKGISLEKRDPQLESAEDRNWSSASPLENYATPGRQNSIAQEPQPWVDLSLSRSWVTPDGDGRDDELCLVIEALPPGTALSAWIFHADGRAVAQLESSLIPGKASVIRWNLTNTIGIVPSGPYILVLTGFDPAGDSFKKKLPFNVVSQY